MSASPWLLIGPRGSRRIEGLQQAFDDVRLAHADRGGQRGGAGVGGQPGIGPAGQQVFDQFAMAAPRRTQQRGAALAVGGVDREAEVQQAAFFPVQAREKGLQDGFHVEQTPVGLVGGREFVVNVPKSRFHGQKGVIFRYGCQKERKNDQK